MITFDTEGFIRLQRLAWAGVTCGLDPGSHFVTVDPNMMGRIPLIWQPFIQPLAHDVRRDM
jgi:hypothetical protein